jgi:hypothetical protein
VTQEALGRTLAAVLESARKLAPDAEVFASATRRRAGNVRFAKGEIISCGDMGDTRLQVRVKLGRRHA